MLNTQKGILQHTDRELVSRILEGDTKAFRQLIAATERLVATMLFKMIPTTADHKDLAQDVYLKVHRNLPNFRFQSKLSTWIGQITYNTCLHYLEKKRPVLFESFCEDGSTNGIHVMSDQYQMGENQTESRLFEKELQQKIAYATGRLSLLYQTLIALYYQQELPIQEIAEITKLPEGTVRAYLFRARRELKDILLRIQKEETI